MTAAIYARKSTEQRGDAETKSTQRQIADARTFAQRLGLPPIDDRFVWLMKGFPAPTCEIFASGLD